MGDSIGHQLGLRKITHILVHVSDDVKRIVARQALEMQCCGSLIAMQNNASGFVAKVEVQIADRIFVRRAGYAGLRPGGYGQCNLYFPRVIHVRFVFI